MKHSKFIINIDSFGHLQHTTDEDAKTYVKTLSEHLKSMLEDRINLAGEFENHKRLDYPYESVKIEKDLHIPESILTNDIIIRHNTENRLYYPSKKVKESTSIDPDKFSLSRLELGHKVSFMTEEEKSDINRFPIILYDINIFIYDAKNQKARHNLKQCFSKSYGELSSHPKCGSQIYAFGFDELKDRVKAYEKDSIREEDLAIMKMDTLRRRAHQIFSIIMAIYESRENAIRDINYKHQEELNKKLEAICDAGTPDGLELAFL